MSTPYFKWRISYEKAVWKKERPFVWDNITWLLLIFTFDLLQNCSCSSTGSLKQQCDPNTGHCDCKKGYEGEKCNSCSFGYYGYPNCRQCTCDPNGTMEAEFANGMARCDEDGRCRCKVRQKNKLHLNYFSVNFDNSRKISNLKKLTFNFFKIPWNFMFIWSLASNLSCRELYSSIYSSRKNSSCYLHISKSTFAMTWLTIAGCHQKYTLGGAKRI